MSFETRVSVLLAALLVLAIGADVRRGSASPASTQPPRKYLMLDDHVSLTYTSERDGVLTAIFSVRPMVSRSFHILGVAADGFELIDQLPVKVDHVDPEDPSVRMAHVRFRRLDPGVRFRQSSIEYSCEQ